MIMGFIQGIHHYILIRHSGLFDHDYYLRTYTDVRKAEIDPLWHFIRWGWKEGRNPSGDFNINYYLSTNQDVKDSKFNPLIHYILHGKNEGRRIKEDNTIDLPLAHENLASNSDNYLNPLAIQIQNSIFHKNQQNRPTLTTIRRYLISSQFHIGSQTLIRLINKNQKYDKYILSLSQDNYLDIHGGVQNKISGEQNNCSKNGIGYLHIHPSVRLVTLQNDISPFHLGIILDENFLGTINSKKLLIAFNHLRINIGEVVIHHTMGFKMDFLILLLQRFSDLKISFWVHDFFSICPNYFLLRNDIEYCHIPNLDSNACKICIYGDLRRKQHQEFQKLFEQFDMEFIFPSESAYSLWKEKQHFNHNKHLIKPHVRIQWKDETCESKVDYPIRVAFVGWPTLHKGWNTYKKLTERFVNDQNYKFYLFSYQRMKGNFQCVSVLVTDEDRQLMKKELQSHEIDVVLLWSLVPETFSYTLFESLSAGCFIITNQYSGNIHHYIKGNPSRGLIVRDDEELIDLFTTSKLLNAIKNYQKNGKPQADMIFL